MEDTNEWYTFETSYVAEADAVTLRIETMSESEGDSTFLVDNVFFGIPGVSECDPNSQGDLDGNGVVEFADFLTLSGNFGMAVSSHTEGDIDCNGTVEFADFLTLSGNFGENVGGSQAVPEPGTASLVGCAMFCLLAIRRGRFVV